MINKMKAFTKKPLGNVNNNGNKIYPVSQWARPSAPNSIMLRTLFKNDDKTIDQSKPFVMFDEIFPKKKSNEDVENGKSYKEMDDTFHRAMGPVLTIGQCFGILPIAGVQDPDTTYLKFNWISWRVLFTLISMACAAGIAIACVMRMVYTGADIYKTIEHVLAIISGVAVGYDCTQGRSVVESFFVNSYEQIFYFTEYALWKGIILQVLNLESTFNWNFMDLFIMVISIGLTDRFELLNERLEATKGKHLPDIFWKVAREEFAHLSRLVKDVDVAINEIVLLSFANNLYFICLQLFNSLKKFRGMAHAVYFTFSFGFLMTRSLAVSLGAARIHSAAQKPAAVLYATPSSSYGTEIQRFLEQVVTDVVALTGLNFFYVTRGLILTISGTIVTYELVLVQFNASPLPVTANITISETCGVPLKTIN